MHKKVPLSSIADDLALSNPTLQRLKALGIISAEDLLGVAKTSPEALAQELEYPPFDIPNLIEELKRHIPREILEALEATEKLPPLSFGAVLDQELG